MSFEAYIKKEKLTAEEEATICGVSGYYFSEDKKENKKTRLELWLPQSLIDDFRKFLKDDRTIYGKNGHAAYAGALYLRWKRGEVTVVETKR